MKNIYIEANGGISMPVTFLGIKTSSVTNMGFNYTGGLGINWDGYLVGFEYSHNMWGAGANEFMLIDDLNSDIIAFRIRRVLSSRSINALPEWLEIVPGIGGGLNFFTGSYYPSERGKEDGRLMEITFNSEGSVAAFGRASLEFSFFFGTNYFIPFIGADCNAFMDESIGGGICFFPKFYGGIRTYPLTYISSRIPKASSSGTGGTSILVEQSVDFTPNNDDVGDIATIVPKYFNTKYGCESWKVVVYDRYGSPLKTWEGTGDVPRKIPWDGDTDNNEIIFSNEIYTASFEAVPDMRDREKLGMDKVTATIPIKTGVFVQNGKNRKEDRIIINSFYFDADDSSFNSISDEQRKSNRMVLDQVASAILDQKPSNVIIEVYSNNVSNTDEENLTELVPLSQKRANAILEELIKRDVKKENLSARGMGGSDPIASWEDKASWWKNRRVEIILEK